MPALAIGVILLAAGAAAWAFGRRDGAPTPTAPSSGAGSAWARSRGTTSGGTTTTTAESSAARICAQSADTISLDTAELGAWADCPGRPIRDLRVLAARLERAAADETDVPRRTRLIDSHVALMDWISRREREAGRTTV